MKIVSLKMIAIFLLTPLTTMAALYEGTEAKECFTNNENSPQQENCLSEQKIKSENKLSALIFETEKRIKANNIGSFNGKEEANETYGDVYSRRFLQAQEKWKEYRHELCLAVATEINEDAWDYQSYRDQCEINLNKRHMEEINLMGLPPVN